MKHDIKSILLTRSYRRLLFLAATAALIVLLGVRYLGVPLLSGEPLPGLSTVVSSILDNLTAALVSSTVVTILILLISYPEERGDFSLIAPIDMKEALSETLRDANDFWYRGHTARWLRTVTFPSLAKDARDHGHSKQVHLVMIDPRCADTCEFYASHRIDVRGREGITWTKKRVQIEALASIISVYIWTRETSNFVVRVALSKIVSHVRIDLSASLGVITSENPREPGLKCSPGSTLYKWFREEAVTAFNQGYELPRTRTLNIVLFRDISLKNLKSMLNGLGLLLPDLTEDDLNEIIKAIKDPISPY